MDVYRLLHEDHRKVASLLEELESTTERVVRSREHLFANLMMELSVHAEAEERCFYSRLEDAEQTRDLTLEALEEHKAAKRLLSELDKDDKATEQWLAKLKVLRENVRHHVEEEEQELFQRAKKVLSADDALAIAEEIIAYKEMNSQLEERI